MIYLKGDGTNTCNRLMTRYTKELSSYSGDSPFTKGEAILNLNPGEKPLLDRKEGTKVIDFSFLNSIISGKVTDINKEDCYSKIEPIVKEISEMSTDIEFCILVPDVERNDAISVRSKLYQELRMKSVGKFKIGKQDNSYYNSYRSNPYLFTLNERNVALLSLDKPITEKLQDEVKNG